jgi:long-chain acyl-CoA synthetase
MTPSSIATINDLFVRIAGAGNPRAVLWQDEFGNWHPISSDQMYQRVRALATAFLRFGVQKGDRIVLISENRWEWASHTHQRTNRRAGARRRLPHRRRLYAPAI